VTDLVTNVRGRHRADERGKSRAGFPGGHVAVVLPVLTGAAYLVAGQRLLLRTGQRVFDVGLTGMTTPFGILLLAT
jgi:hypothetical protein